FAAGSLVVACSNSDRGKPTGVITSDMAGAANGPGPTGNPDMASGGGGGSCSGVATGLAAGGSCISRSCCPPGSACTGNKDCSALLACIKNCADSTCEQNCATANQAGVTAFNAVAMCLNSSCSAQCTGGGSGGAGGGGGGGGGAGVCGGLSTGSA